MHIEYTKCPYIINLLRSNFSLEQAMTLYKFERLGIKCNILHYRYLSVDQLEYLCDILRLMKHKHTNTPKNINSIGNLSVELDKLTDFPNV